MSETTSFNPSDEYINALLCKVAYEGVIDSKSSALYYLRKLFSVRFYYPAILSLISALLMIEDVKTGIKFLHK